MFNRKVIVPITICLLMIFSIGQSILLSQAQETATPSGYADLQNTEIRGISAEDIEGYRTGSGLGFALPAELNGYPGPKHVLGMADELTLSPSQRDAIQLLYDDMLPEAIALGEAILSEEAALEEAFREESITDDYLLTQLSTVESLRSDLRYIHLSTHLATLDILTRHQVQQYNNLRGYGESTHGEQNSH